MNNKYDEAAYSAYGSEPFETISLKTFYALAVKRKNVNFTYCDLTMSLNVGQHLIADYNLNTDTLISNVNIAFSTSITKKPYNNMFFKKGIIKHSSLIVIDIL